MVSAVSGGSITAAYYTLYGDRIFSDYESRFLKRHAQTGLLLRTLGSLEPGAADFAEILQQRFGGGIL